jgi:hypothetical protein
MEPEPIPPDADTEETGEELDIDLLMGDSDHPAKGAAEVVSLLTQSFASLFLPVDDALPSGRIVASVQRSIGAAIRRVCAEIGAEEGSD